MGEVVAAYDETVEREVAVKRMRFADPTDEMSRRFLREAKIQARLDHPAIVPVHALGTDAAQNPYFTMKRLVGTTLSARLTLRDAALQPLLRAFVDVCFAIQFAHERGVQGPLRRCLRRARSSRREVGNHRRVLGVATAERGRQAGCACVAPAATRTVAIAARQSWRFTMQGDAGPHAPAIRKRCGRRCRRRCRNTRATPRVPLCPELRVQLVGESLRDPEQVVANALERVE